MLSIRKGTKEDLPGAMLLIQELADYEKASSEVANSVEQMEQDGFGPNPIFQFFVAENLGKILGVALYYYSYSTWKGKCIHLEDLVVTASQRQNGIGGKLFKRMMQQAKEEDVARLTWQVLDWNEPAIKFYEKYKANFDGEWINCKFTDAQLKEC